MPEDRISLEVDGKILFDLKGSTNYLSNEFFLLPLIQSKDIKKITVESEDANQDIKSPNQLCLTFGKFEDLRWQNSIMWFFKTGINLFSAYFLLIITFFLILSFWLRKSGLGLSLLTYSAVSTIYLLSFSEYPRALFDPVLLSGGIHFPLRLLQDMCLVFVFYNFYQKQETAYKIKRLALIYASVIVLYLILLIWGIRDYIYFSRIIIVLAPLVAAPMGIGTWFAFKLTDQTERKVLIPVSILLLCFQLNDLFVFWKFFDGYFTVRFYIPFIVSMLLFLYFRRMYVDALEAQTSAERQRIFKEFLHDVKSPIAVLKVFFAGITDSNERQMIIQSALDRIEGMVRQVESKSKEENKQKIKLSDSIKEIIDQKIIEFPDFHISFTCQKECSIYGDKLKLQRIFSNIINNSYESCVRDKKLLNVSLNELSNLCHITFSDNGSGIPDEMQKKLFTQKVSTKENGSGIGLTSAYRYITSLGGEIKITSTPKKGTSIEIKINTIPESQESTTINNFKNQTENKKIQNYDFVLIDDDKYIRLSWEYYARNASKNVLTFSSIESFLGSVDTLNKDCPIYLDLNLNGEKSIKYIDTIYNLGFSNIIMATGENISLEELPKNISRISGKLPPLF